MIGSPIQRAAVAALVGGVIVVGGPAQEFARAQVTDTQQNDTAVARSAAIVRAILDDLERTYQPAGGGGISAITQAATTRYTVSILQEGKVDHIAYTVTMGEDGTVSIIDRKETVETK